MTASDWLMVASTLLGPILAVQAQKWVERGRDADRSRSEIFKILMATRQARVSPDHVAALNSIELAFYGSRIFKRKDTFQAVLEAWHEYHAHLTPPPDRRPKVELEHRAWESRGDELFINLLEKLAKATKFKIARAQLQSGSYSPEGPGFVQSEQHEIRRRSLELLRGDGALPMVVKEWPVHPEAAQRQDEIHRRLIEVLEKLSDRT